MLELAEQRAKQLREQYGFANAGVYDPPGVGGTGVIYVLHDATQAGDVRRPARESVASRWP